MIDWRLLNVYKIKINKGDILMNNDRGIIPFRYFTVKKKQLT